MDMSFMKGYIVSWWQKIVRRYVYGQTGPAENATVNMEQAKQYSPSATKTTGEPTNVYELIDNLKQNKWAYSTQILTYLQDNNIPNKSTQIDLFIDIGQRKQAPAFRSGRMSLIQCKCFRKSLNIFQAIGIMKETANG
jgi:hypothetical protein